MSTSREIRLPSPILTRLPCDETMVIPRIDSGAFKETLEPVTQAISSLAVFLSPWSTMRLFLPAR